MTPDERQRLRHRLAAAVARGTFPGADDAHPGPPPADAALAPADRRARFDRELAALGGFVHDAGTPDDVARIIDGLLPPDPPRAVLMWDDAWLPMPGVADALRARGIDVLRQEPADAQADDRRRAFAAVGVGITGAEACLAPTGSLVVVSGPGRGRLVSLLPPVHVALVTHAQLGDSLQALLAARPDLVTAGANFVCITGPSRTADIELTLSRGVHGPREVHAIFVG